MVLPSILAYWNINNYQITEAINNPVFFKSTYNKLLLFGKIFNTPDLIDVSNNSQYIKFEGGVGSEGNYLSTIASEKITYDDNFTYEGDNFFPSRWTEKDFSFSLWIYFDPYTTPSNSGDYILFSIGNNLPGYSLVKINVLITTEQSNTGAISYRINYQEIDHLGNILTLISDQTIVPKQWTHLIFARNRIDQSHYYRFYQNTSETCLMELTNLNLSGNISSDNDNTLTTGQAMITRADNNKITITNDLSILNRNGILLFGAEYQENIVSENKFRGWIKEIYIFSKMISYQTIRDLYTTDTQMTVITRIQPVPEWTNSNYLMSSNSAGLDKNTLNVTLTNYSITNGILDVNNWIATYGSSTTTDITNETNLVAFCQYLLLDCINYSSNLLEEKLNITFNKLQNQDTVDKLKYCKGFSVIYGLKKIESIVFVINNTFNSNQNSDFFYLL